MTFIVEPPNKVNSQPPPPTVFPPLSATEDHFASVSIGLGGRGLLILRRLAYLCAKSGGLSCIVSQDALSRRAKCSHTTTKDKLSLLTGFGLIIKENRLPAWIKDEDGTRKPRWRSNRYTFTDLGMLFMGQWKSSKKLQGQQSPYRSSDTWDREKPKNKPDKRVRQVCELQRKIDGVYVASEVAALPIKKRENKKGDSFFYGLERETENAQFRGTEVHPENRGKGEAGSRDESTRDTGGDDAENERAKDPVKSEQIPNELDQEVSTLQKTDPHKYALLHRKIVGIRRRKEADDQTILQILHEITNSGITDWSRAMDKMLRERSGVVQEPSVAKSQPKPRTPHGSCQIGADREILRQKNTTSDTIDKEVIEWTSRDPKLYKNLDTFVRTLRRDNFSPSVISLVIGEICGTQFPNWWGWGNNLAKKHRQEEKESQIRNERALMEAKKINEKFDCWEKERDDCLDKSLLVGGYNLTGMFLAEQKKTKQGKLAVV